MHVNDQVKIGNKAHFKVWRKRLLKLADVYLMHTEQRPGMSTVDLEIPITQTASNFDNRYSTHHRIIIN